MGTLYIIATPIGNLEDATFRSIATLKKLDALFVEDTRVTGRLLERYGIKVPMQSYREDSHGLKMPKMLELLRAGKTVGLVSDAGTPAIADPGFRMVRDVLRAEPDTAIIPIAGVSAVTAALSVAGFPSDEFTFLGFPPHKKGRNAFFKDALEQPRTTVLYESTHRIEKALASIGEYAPERRLVVCRELTKMFETTYRGTATHIAERLASTSSKGEFVIVMEGKS